MISNESHKLRIDLQTWLTCVFRLYMTKNIYFTLVVLCELRCKRLFAVVSVKTQVTVALILCTVPSHGIASACARELLLAYFRAWARAKLSGAES